MPTRNSSLWKRLQKTEQLVERELAQPATATSQTVKAITNIPAEGVAAPTLVPKPKPMTKAELMSGFPAAPDFD